MSSFTDDIHPSWPPQENVNTRYWVAFGKITNLGGFVKHFLIFFYNGQGSYLEPAATGLIHVRGFSRAAPPQADELPKLRVVGVVRL